MNEDLLNNIMQTVASLPPPKDTTDTNRHSTNEIPNKQPIIPEFSLNSISQKSINILGFDLFFDDIIIIAIILFLLQEEHKDYLLIAVLGLMFFDFSLDKLLNSEPVKKLLNNLS